MQDLATTKLPSVSLQVCSDQTRSTETSMLSTDHILTSSLSSQGSFQLKPNCRMLEHHLWGDFHLHFL